MTFKELLQEKRLNKAKQDHKIDYNQEITKDNYDNSFIVIIDNKKYCITKRLTEDDII